MLREYLSNSFIVCIYWSAIKVPQPMLDTTGDWEGEHGGENIAQEMDLLELHCEHLDDEMATS